MESFDGISMLKLRGSWGEIGNQQTSDLYPSIPGYPTNEPEWINLDTGLRYTSLNPAGLVSSSFTWEKVRTTNIGLDVAILKNRLSASADVYRRETLGMLEKSEDLPAILGTSAPDKNVADLQTQGWELELKWNDKKGALNYSINVNLANREGKYTKFPNESGAISQIYVGQKEGEIWGYVTEGYYTVDDFVEGTLDAHLAGVNRKLKDNVQQIEGAPIPFPGDIKYADLNGDLLINDGNNTLANPGDRKIIGNSVRKYQFGINGFAEYKGFDFSFILSGVGKRDIWLNSDLIWPYPSGFDHIYAHQLDYWTPDNQDGFYPRIYGDKLRDADSNYGRSRMVQTKYMSDGSYLKIQNITFGYTFNKAILQRIKLSSLRLFVSGNNIHTFDNLPRGLDPDQNDNGAYPFMRNYSFGLNVSF